MIKKYVLKIDYEEAKKWDKEKLLKEMKDVGDFTCVGSSKEEAIDHFLWLSVEERAKVIAYYSLFKNYKTDKKTNWLTKVEFEHAKNGFYISGGDALIACFINGINIDPEWRYVGVEKRIISKTSYFKLEVEDEEVIVYQFTAGDFYKFGLSSGSRPKLNITEILKKHGIKEIYQVEHI